MIKGILYGLAFVLTYVISNLEVVNNLFEGTEDLYHIVKAWILFTLGFVCSSLNAKIRK